MTGMERIEALLAGKPADRPPFLPAVYEHKAALIGATPSAVARNVELLERALARELEVYEPDALTVGLDVYNVEAEAAGAKVRFFDGPDVPIVTGRPLRPGQDVGLLPLPDPERSGRMPVFLEAGRRLQAYVGGEVLVRGALSAPFSMAAELLGDEPLLLSLLDEPDWAASLLDFCAVAVQAYGKAFADRGLGVILFDSHAAPPLVSPAPLSPPHPAPDRPGHRLFPPRARASRWSPTSSAATRRPFCRPSWRPGRTISSATSRPTWRPSWAVSRTPVSSSGPTWTRASFWPPPRRPLKPARPKSWPSGPSVPASCWGPASCPSTCRPPRSRPSAGPWGGSPPPPGLILDEK